MPPRPNRRSHLQPARVSFDTASIEGLVQAIVGLCRRSLESASRAVNLQLTARNWLIGKHIIEFEQAGQTRAAYGEQLLVQLAERLEFAGLKRVDARELRRFRLFFLQYPELREPLRSMALPLLQTDSLRPEAPPTPPFRPDTDASEFSNLELLQRLSFSHFAALLELPDGQQRRFYESQAIRGVWSCRELKRQIASLAFERQSLASGQAEPQTDLKTSQTFRPADVAIRDPYVFEFLGLGDGAALEESQLEAALLDRLKDFLLELGHGFCFEARQKRILIGDEHFFIDLVFYHRILKCHILVELKAAAFSHEHLGQLNTYLAYYKDRELNEGDRPPIGLLLCTRKNEALVRYAIGDLPNQVFVSRYELRLPQRTEIEAFLREVHRDFGNSDI